MKICLSKKEPGKARHVTLVYPRSEEFPEMRQTIYNDVLHASANPVKEVFTKRLPSGQVEPMVRYRFAMKWLEDLTLTFPFAEMSAGLENRLTEQVRHDLNLLKTPELYIPGFKGELKDFQKVSVYRMIKAAKKKSVFRLNTSNDEMGLGKTVQVLAFLCAVKKFPALVIVPNSLTVNWLRENAKFTDLNMVIVSGTRAERAEILAQDADIFVINKEALRVKKIHYDNDADGAPLYQYEPVLPPLFERKFKVIVVDEYHHFKNPEAQQTIGLHMLESKIKIVMSGTPMLNGRPEEMWSILHWTNPKKFPDYNSFVRKHVVKKGGKSVSYKKLKEIKKYLYGDGILDESARTIRRRREHVKEQLPQVIYKTHMVQLTPEQRRLYDQINDELLLWIEEDPKRIFNALSQMTRLRQAAFSPELYDGSQHSAKLDELREIVKSLVDNGEKAIVFTQWKKAVAILEREFAEYNPAIVTGAVKVQKGSIKRGNVSYPRQDQVDKFNEDDDCKMFIGTLKACKEGFTLSAGTYVILVDKDWVPANNDQAIGRSAAGGLRGIGVPTVTVIELQAEDTIEQWIEDLLANKRRMNNRMTEMDAGTKIERMDSADIMSLLTRNNRRGKRKKAA